MIMKMNTTAICAPYFGEFSGILPNVVFAKSPGNVTKSEVKSIGSNITREKIPQIIIAATHIF
jgi:hypothetical protein